MPMRVLCNRSEGCRASSIMLLVGAAMFGDVCLPDLLRAERLALQCHQVQGIAYLPMVAAACWRPASGRNSYEVLGAQAAADRPDQSRRRRHVLDVQADRALRLVGRPAGAHYSSPASGSACCSCRSSLVGMSKVAGEDTGVAASSMLNVGEQVGRWIEDSRCSARWRGARWPTASAAQAASATAAAAKTGQRLSAAKQAAAEVAMQERRALATGFSKRVPGLRRRGLRRPA